MDESQGFQINKPKVIFEDYHDEMVIINLDTGNYYSLLHTGIDIWNAIERGASVGNIVAGILQRYEGQRQEIEQAVHQLLSELQKEELVTPASANGKVTMEASNLQTSKPPFHTPVLKKYSDMQDLLLLDPIHEVDETGWPSKAQPPQA